MITPRATKAVALQAAYEKACSFMGVRRCSGGDFSSPSFSALHELLRTAAPLFERDRDRAGYDTIRIAAAISKL
jgi:hypothetical protein